MLARQLETWELGNDRNFTALRVLVFEKLSAYTDLLSRPFEGSGTWVRLRPAFIVMTVGLGADVTALELVGNGGTEAAGDTARSLARHSLHKYPCGGGFIVSEEKEPADGRADGGNCSTMFSQAENPRHLGARALADGSRRQEEARNGRTGESLLSDRSLWGDVLGQPGGNCISGRKTFVVTKSLETGDFSKSVFTLRPSASSRRLG